MSAPVRFLMVAVAGWALFRGATAGMLPGIEAFAVERVDPLTIKRTGKIKGQVVETGTWKLSPDGKTLTIVTEGEVEGQKYKNLQVFERLEE